MAIAHILSRVYLTDDSLHHHLLLGASSPWLWYGKVNYNIFEKSPGAEVSSLTIEHWGGDTLHLCGCGMNEIGAGSEFGGMSLWIMYNFGAHSLTYCPGRSMGERFRNIKELLGKWKWKYRIPWGYSWAWLFYACSPTLDIQLSLHQEGLTSHIGPRVMLQHRNVYCT